MPLFMEQVCMKIDSSLNLIDNVINNVCCQWSYRLLIGCTFHLWPKFTANNNNNTIRVPINSQVCIIIIRTKNEKETQFFAKVYPWEARKLGLAGPNICDHHGMSFQPLFCHLLGHGNAKEFTSIRYCQAFNIEET